MWKPAQDKRCFEQKIGQKIFKYLFQFVISQKALVLVPRLVDVEGILCFANFGAHWTEVALALNVVHLNVVSQVGLILGREVTVCAAPEACPGVPGDLGVDGSCKVTGEGP